MFEASLLCYPRSLESSSSLLRPCPLSLSFFFYPRCRCSSRSRTSLSGRICYCESSSFCSLIWSSQSRLTRFTALEERLACMIANSLIAGHRTLDDWPLMSSSPSSAHIKFAATRRCRCCCTENGKMPPTSQTPCSESSWSSRPASLGTVANTAAQADPDA